MTLILKLDLDMVKMYLHAKNEVSMLWASKVIASTDRNTDRQTDIQTDTQTETQTHRQTHRHTDKHTDIQTHRQTHRHTDMTENITYPHILVVTSINATSSAADREVRSKLVTRKYFIVVYRKSSCYVYFST